MTGKRNLEAELDALKRDIAALRQRPNDSGEPHFASALKTELASELGEMRKLVDDMLNDAEESMNAHPVATVAGALALGILIGRLTARG